MEATDLFAGIPVTDYEAARGWYERLFGAPPAFFPHDTEAVWALAEHRYVYVVRDPEHAGHARVMVFVADLDAHVADLAGRGLTPSKEETHGEGVRKITYTDADGNETSFGGAPS
ncbi:VOC family protein [Actinophytocola oryzae]|uniref:VOC domain-containing protein n=1 Tax=Actinophytocola oryzae TaxID=502181 RepID=A0A4R7UNX7_9PSEU|nr:VOC family protein [Actinophytocola oryzae]TDV34899.1 hypothetical protein CLV71_13718 [Actinophytocola oryzae]